MKHAASEKIVYDENPMVLEMMKPLLDITASEENISEIAINNIEEEGAAVYVRRHGDIGWTPEHTLKWSYQQFMDTAYAFANTRALAFDENHLPMFSEDFCGHRFTFIGGTNVRYKPGDRFGVALTMRKLHSSGVKNIVSTTEPIERTEKEKLKNLPNKGRLREIHESLHDGKGIIVVGATNSGKTRFLTHLMEQMPLYRRPVLIEDTRELILNQPNRVCLYMPRTQGTNATTYRNFVDLVNRMSTDMVIVAELTEENSRLYVSLMSTGQGGVLTTVHGNTPLDGISQLINRVGTDEESKRSIAEGLRRSIGFVCLMENGKLVNSQTIDELFENPSLSRYLTERLL